MTNLVDRVVLVTGAAGNVGRAVAEAAHRAGARLALIDREAEPLRAVVPAAADAVRLPDVDLSDEAATDGAVETVFRQLGRLDGVVATVGGFHSGSTVAAEGWEPFERMLAMNLRPTVSVVRAAAPLLGSPGGRIVTVGARPGLAAPAGMAAYAAAKAAVIRLTEGLAAELADREITANCVLPSVIDTPQNRAAMPEADPTRWVSPAALADVVLFLLSDLSRAVSGAAIPVYGRS